jgi:Ca2+-binding EF-hand superfamily protein|uniref:EF-hand domain-containing protein n=1 Tax=Eutreptiella gymnastica TaxID=73025 RepID=A0A7S4FQD6_9EUGL
MASREVQAILQEIRKHIEQRYSSIQEAFLKVDTDRSNSITGDELATIFKVHNVKVHPRDLERLINAFDANKDGRVDYTEFCRTLESGPYVDNAPARAAPQSPPRPTPPLHAPMSLDSPKQPQTSDARVQQLLAFFRRAVDQCYNSLHEAFIRIDTDRSGTISAQELIALLYDHNVHASWSDILALVELLDINGDGIIDYNEFCRAVDGRPPPKAPAPSQTVPLPAPEDIDINSLETMHRSLRKWCCQSSDSLREAFLKMSTSRSGVVTLPELAAAVGSLCKGTDMAAAQRLMEEYDLNRDGVIQYNEFVKAMSYDTLY